MLATSLFILKIRTQVIDLRRSCHLRCTLAMFISINNMVTNEHKVLLEPDFLYTIFNKVNQ